MRLSTHFVDTLARATSIPWRWWVRTRVLGEKLARVVPLEQAFPDAETVYRHPPETMAIPELLDVPVWSTVADVQKPMYESPDLRVRLVQNGYYCSTNRVLLAPNRAVVAESLSTLIGDRLPAQPHHPFRGAATYTEDVRHLSGLCTTFQMHRRNYYHTLVDALPRLWLLHELDLDEPISVLCSDLSPAELFFVDQLLPENATLVPVEEGPLYAVDRFLHLPFLSRQSVGYLPKDYLRFFRQRVLPDRPPARNRRVLVTRKDAGTRCIRNLDEVETCLSRYGFESVALESLGMAEQIELFYDADVIVATHGAGLANLLFAGADTRVLESFPHSFVIPTYFLLSKALDLPYEWILGTESDRYADYDVDVRSLSDAMKSLCVGPLST